MKRLLLLLVLAAIPVDHAAQSASASVEGVLVDFFTGGPIPKATLDLQSITNSSVRYPATTGTDGKFTFRNVEPGRYSLTSSRTGYVRSQFGQRGPNSNAALLTVTAGQRVTDVRMAMIRSSTISGRLIDVSGEAIPDAQVHVWKASYRDGWRVMVPVASMASNDLGEYRFFGLPPGQYYLSAQPEPSDTIRSPSYAGLGPPMPGAVVTSFSAGQTGTISDRANASFSPEKYYAPIFFGGSSDVFSAAPINLASGNELRNPDFVVERVTTLTISGSILDATTGMPVRNATIIVTPFNPNLQFTTASVVNVTGGKIIVDNTNMMPVDRNGQFRSMSMPPGTYLLTAFADSAGVRIGGQLKVDLKYSDLGDVRIPVSPGRSISGQITGIAAADLARVRVGLKSTVASMLDVPQQISSNGRFTLQNAVAGDYIFNISGLDAGYVKEIRMENLDLLNDALRVANVSQGEVQVVIGNNAGRLRGFARDENGAPLSNVTVALLPAPAQRQRIDLYQSMITDAAGAFHFEHLPPGQYKLFAWEDVEKDSWRDPAFMRLYEINGKELTVSEGTSADVDIPVIRLR